VGVDFRSAIADDLAVNELAQAMVAGGVGVILGYLYAPSKSDWRRVLAYARRRSDR
jgi:hypothetical protein